jgi:filamentous hemagglutinin
MDNTVSELLVAGYMKMLDGDFWGLSTSTLAMRDIMLIYGNEGLHLDGHSRGGMTIGNALESIDKMEGSQGLLGQTTLNLFGSAYSSTHANAILGRLQDRSQKNNPDDWNVMQSTHIADFVGRFIGGNPATGGKIPQGSTWIKEVKRVLGEEQTAHNCYGASTGRTCSALWGKQDGDYVDLSSSTKNP